MLLFILLIYCLLWRTWSTFILISSLFWFFAYSVTRLIKMVWDLLALFVVFPFLAMLSLCLTIYHNLKGTPGRETLRALLIETEYKIDPHSPQSVSWFMHGLFYWTLKFKNHDGVRSAIFVSGWPCLASRTGPACMTQGSTNIVSSTSVFLLFSEECINWLCPKELRCKAEKHFRFMDINKLK